MSRIIFFFENKYTKISCLIIALVYSLSFIFWGRGAMDPYYWINRYADYSEYFMVSGSLFVGYIWGEVFGNTLLSLRFLGWIFSITAILLPYFILQPRKYYFKNIYYLLFGIFLLGYGSYNEFSPGSSTMLAISILVVLLYKYFEQRKTSYLIALGIMSSIAICFRFPNVLVLPVISFSLLVYYLIEKKKDTLNYFKDFIQPIGIYLLISTTVYIALVVLMMNNGDIISLGTNSVSKANTGDHSVFYMLKMLLSDLNDILLYCGVLFLFAYLVKVQKININKFVKYIVYFVILILFAYFLKSNIGTHKWFNWPLHVFISSIAISAIIVIVYRSLKRKNAKEALFYFSILLLGVVAPMGSDTRWLKLFPILCCFLPVLLINMHIDWRKNKLVIALVFIFSSYVLVCYAQNNISKGTRGNVLQMTETVDCKVLKNIYLTKNDAEYVETILHDYTLLGETDNTIFYGNAAHFPYSVTESKPVYEYPFRMYKNDQEQLDIVMGLLQTKSCVLFDFEKNDSEYFFNKLKNLNYIEVSRNDEYIVYKKL